MVIPQKISSAADRLRHGHRVNRITVRDFLKHFGVERRGASKIEAIRTILDQLGLETEPDFSTVWIDAPIWLKLKGDPLPDNDLPSESLSPDALEQMVEDVLDSTPASVEAAEQQVKDAPFSADATVPTSEPSLDASNDPTFRIGSLPAANKKLVVAGENDSLTRAVTLMLQNDFSQLPVMHGQREVKGVVTWKSIAVRKSLDCKCDLVKDCSEEPQIVDSNRTLFDAIPIIVEHGYVFVRDQRDRKITGIVTASDLSLQFQALAEPFLLIREVELHLRELLGDKITQSDLDELSSAGDSPHAARDIDDLSFGEYVRLFQNPRIWAKLQLRVDQSVLTGLLESVRLIRNDVMHFDPDPMTSEELAILKKASKLMQTLYELLP